jgi:hypothetical protein
MNIGIVSYFAFRPHVEHMYVLSKMLEESGHNIFSLSCDSALTTCYKRELTKTSRVSECLKCTAGGLRSYPVANLTSARHYQRKEDLSVDGNVVPQWGHSSACTVFRAETENEKVTEQFISLKAKLSKAAWQSYQISKRWIDDKKLDAIVCFNGRMEATRGVLEAAKAMQIRYVSVERSWGDGLLLLPETDCLGLQDLHEMVKEYRSRPLTLCQSYKAAQVVASRFLKKNVTEWRAYNLNSVSKEWPVKTGSKRILILPSSYNEYDGHPDWKMKWKDQFDAFNNLIDNLGLSADSFIMRGHPNWSETIGASSGERIQFYYENWAKEKGIYYIPSSSNISTQSLISQADMVVLNGGSAAIEAGLLGKPIISLVETPYKFAGFVINYLSPGDNENLAKASSLDAKTIRRMTLRFLYTWCFRFMQYTREIKAQDSIHYTYSDNLNAESLMKIIRSGKVHADDQEIATDETQEAVVLGLIENGEWGTIFNFNDPKTESHPRYRKYTRRALYRVIDKIRSLMPIGDR